MGHGCGFLGFVMFCSPPKTFFPTQGNGSEWAFPTAEQGKDTNPMGFFHSNPMGREWEPLDVFVVFPVRTAAIPRQVSTGIWIGATSAFQQRLAQREQLATELSFLEGMLHGGEADGESSRTFVALHPPRMGVESRETLGIGEYIEMGFTSENVSLPDGGRISLCSTGNYAQDRARISNCLQSGVADRARPQKPDSLKKVLFSKL